jgi:hypothetical protein
LKDEEFPLKDEESASDFTFVLTRTTLTTVVVVVAVVGKKIVEDGKEDH